jgi:hypothetical protein
MVSAIDDRDDSDEESRWNLTWRSRNIRWKIRAVKFAERGNPPRPDDSRLAGKNFMYGIFVFVIGR